MSSLDIFGAILGFALTLMVFSYLIGDNPLFRVAIHVFIGVASGYATIMVINNVLLPRLIVPLISGSLEARALAFIPMLLGWLLLTKISPRLAVFGNIPVAYLVGVGAAVAIGGAVVGTLYPQVNATIAIFDLNTIQGFDSNRGLQLVNGLIILVGTVTTLAFFQFGTGTQLPNPTGVRSWLDGLGQVGQVFIAIALGFLFAGVYSAAMVALVERLSFIVDFLKSVLMPLLTS
jgi:hypothetical protein